mgnify:CR=1 FL=1
MENAPQTIRDLEAAADHLIDQITQMQGLFDDDDESLTQAIKDAAKAISASRENRLQPKELVFRGDSATQLYACAKCGQCYSPKIYACPEPKALVAAKRAATECCTPPQCACGAPISKGWTACAPCREARMLRRAKTYPSTGYIGPVSANCRGEWGDGFSSNLETMIQHCHDYDEPLPAYCHPCHEHRLRLDPEGLLEMATDGMHEDADDQIENADELIEFINAWNAKQTCRSYSPDYSRVIVLDQVRFRKLREHGLEDNPEGLPVEKGDE